QLLQRRNRLLALRLGFLLMLLIFELAVVENSTNRRARTRCDLDQIELRFFRPAQRVRDCDDANLAAVGSNEPYLRDANPLVDAVSLLRWWDEPWTSTSKRQMTSF